MLSNLSCVHSFPPNFFFFRKIEQWMNGKVSADLLSGLFFSLDNNSAKIFFFFKIQLILHPWLSWWTTILQSFRQFCSSECILHLAQVMWVYPKNNNHAFWRFFESSKEFQKDLHSSKEYWRVPERSKEFVRIPKKERMSFPTRPTLDFTRIFLFMSVQPWNWQGNHSQTVRYHLSSS